MKRFFLSLVILSFSLATLLNSFAQTPFLSPDVVYPIPGNYGNENIEGVNLFTGQVNKTIPLIQLQGVKVSYTLNLFYNSASARLINTSASNYRVNAIGGYGWKLMDYPKIVEDGNGYYLLDGQASYPLQSLGNNAYTPGGKYYLWKVMNKGANQWEIAREDGVHFKFNSPAVSGAGGIQVWNFTSMKQVLWQDSIQFSYSQAGNLTGMINTIGDTLSMSYSGSPDLYLNQVSHRRNGRLVSTMNLSYSNYVSVNGNSYQLLSSLTHNHQISGLHFAPVKAATKFSYLQPGTIAPLNGVNYTGALSTLTTSDGAVYTYTYQSTSAGGFQGYKVVQYTVNDGYRNFSGDTLDANTYNAISYDSTNLLVDTGNVYRYYNRIYLAPGGRFNGVKQSTKTPFGNIEYYFLNGQPAAALKDLPKGYNVATVNNLTLKGLTYQKLINSDSLVGDSLKENVALVNYWEVGYLNAPSTGPFPKLTKTYDEMYKVGKWITYQYGTAFQLPVSISTARRNPEPNSPEFNRDSLITRYTYAFQTYPVLQEDNLYYLNEPSQVINLVQEDMQGSFKVTDCNCTQWTQWDGNGLPNPSAGYWAPLRTVQMRNWGADTTKCLSATVTDSNWLINGLINRRGVYGVVTDSLDESEMNNAVIVSIPQNGGKTVAYFSNANVGTLSGAGRNFTMLSRNVKNPTTNTTYKTKKKCFLTRMFQKRSVSTPATKTPLMMSSNRIGLTAPVQNANADFLGFEPYEHSYTSFWNSNNPKINSDYAHTGEQSFSGNLFRTFTPGDTVGRFYKLGLWTRVANTGDSSSIALKNQSGSLMARNSASYMQGSSSLRYIEAVAFVDKGQSVQVTINTYGAAFVDDIVFMPVDAVFNAGVYDMDRNIQIAQLGVNGQTTHLVHNRFNELVAQVGPGSIQNINNLQIPSSSRIGNLFVNGQDTFDPLYPNMMLNVSARSDGNWQGFEYKSNNSFPPANLVNMSIQNEWLTATSNNASATFSHSIATDHFGLYTEIFPNDLTSGEEIGFTVQLDSISYANDTIVNTRDLKFVLTNNSIKLYSGNTIYKSLPISQVLNNTSLLFEVAGYNYVICYANGRYLFEYDFGWGLIHGPAKLVTNNTGAGFDNFIYVASPSIQLSTFDALNRSKQQLMRTDQDQLSISEVLYGGPLNLPLAQTRLATIGGDGSDISLSYKPNFASGFNSDSMSVGDTSTLGGAANYDNPFSTSVQYSNSPLLEIVGLGGGGQFTVGKKGQHYSSFSYGDAAGNIFNYTNSEMLVTKKTEPNGIYVYTFTNRSMTKFAEARIDGNDTLKTQYEYDNKARLIRIYDPNYYNTKLANNQNFTREYTYDLIGNRTMESSPDKGNTYFIYDVSGNLRFSMDSSGSASSPDQIVYKKYDGLGRLYEEGILNKNWNRDSLQYFADQYDNYPSAAGPGKPAYNWRKLYVYDGDGKTPNQGKLTSVASNWDGDLSAEVSETFVYDDYGNTIQKGLLVSDFDGKTRNVSYQYDLENRISQIDYPGTNQPSTVYTYDGNGQVIGVGIPDNWNYYAEYDYGYQTTEYLNNRNFMRNYGYNNAGWPTTINDPLFNESLSYEQKNSPTDSTYDYNGKIAQLSNSLKWNSLSVNANYTYDNNARITTANYGVNNPWNLGLTSPVQYDQDGNIQSLQRGKTPALQFLYNKGTNQTQTIQGFPQNYIYSGNGSVVSVPYGVTNIQYDPVSLLTTSAFYNGATVSYQYNGPNQRVLKKVAYSNNKQTKRMYVHGLNDYPLMEVYQDSSGKSVTTFYIYGPKGLIAMQQASQRLFILKDHIGSTRVVIDTANNVKAFFNFSSFGNTMSFFVDTSIAQFALNYLYTGQEVENELGGIYNYRARLYDPGTGRFYSPDPLMQFASPYEYAGNNPINNTDPTGKWSWKSFGIGLAIGAAIVAVAAVAIVVAAPIIVSSGTLVAAYGLGSASVLTVGGVALAANTSVGIVVSYAGAAIAATTVVAVAGIIGGLAGSNSSSPPPIVADEDGISEPVRVHASDFGITGRVLQGYYSFVDLTKAQVSIPNNDNNSFVNCPKPGTAGQLQYPYRVIFKAKNDAAQFANCGCTAADQTTLNPDWTDFYTNTLWVNSNFFDIATASTHPYNYPCTNILGVSLSNSQLISNWPAYPAWTSGSVTYNLDALVFYKAGKGGSKKSEIKLYTDLNSTWLNDNVENAVGGIYFLRNDTFDPSLYAGVVSSANPEGRTAIGISDNGDSLLVLEVDNKVIPNSPQGVSFADMVVFFRAKGYKNVINLDGNGSSAFLYTKNGKEYKSCPMDNRNTTNYTHRPIPNFIAFKKK